MAKKESGRSRQYTEEFKVEAVRLAESIGGNAAASRLGVAQSTVANWVRRRKGLGPLRYLPWWRGDRGGLGGTTLKSRALPKSLRLRRISHARSAFRCHRPHYRQCGHCSGLIAGGSIGLDGPCRRLLSN